MSATNSFFDQFFFARFKDAGENLKGAQSNITNEVYSVPPLRHASIPCRAAIITDDKLWATT